MLQIGISIIIVIIVITIINIIIIIIFIIITVFIIIMSIRTYLGKKWSSLSANPMNDIKDVSSILHKVSFKVILVFLVINGNE